MLKYFDTLVNEIGPDWPKFINEIKLQSDKQNKNQVDIDKLLELIEKYGGSIPDGTRESLLDTFPGVDESGENKKVHVFKLYKHSFSVEMNKVYDEVNLADIKDWDEEAGDTAGYLGNFQRSKQKLEPITEDEFFKLLNNDKKLEKVFREIRYIDQDHNGFVTITELDDILKVFF